MNSRLTISGITDRRPRAIKISLVRVFDRRLPDPMDSVRAISVAPKPSFLSLMTSAAFLRAVGALPLYRPSALALAMPSRWRSSSISRSNSSNASEHRQHELASRGSGVDAEVQDPKADPLAFSRSMSRPEVLDGPREPVQLRDDQGIAFPNEVDGCLKLRPFRYGRNLLLENPLTADRIKLSDLSVKTGDLIEGGGPGSSPRASTTPIVSLASYNVGRLSSQNPEPMHVRHRTAKAHCLAGAKPIETISPPFRQVWRRNSSGPAPARHAPSTREHQRRSRLSPASSLGFA